MQALDLVELEDEVDRRVSRLLKSTRSTSPTLLVLGFTLLIAAWLMATHPFAAPDEASHYLRALNIANGHLLGPRVAYPPVPGLTPAQLAWVDRDTRAVRVPSRLSPPDVGCLNGKPDLNGSCLEATPLGNFPPWGYILPAAAIGVSHGGTTALWLSRLASMVPALAFLTLAIALLWNGTGWSLLGLVAAVSPMVLFVASILNSSGLEITACLALTSAVLRISRAPALAPTWTWVSLGTAGTFATISWPLGLVFVLANIALFVALLGPRGVEELRVERRRQAGLAAAMLLAGVVVWFVYSRLSGLSPARFGISPVFRSLHEGLQQMGRVLDEAVGKFGSLTVPLATPAYWLWWLLVVVLVASALWVGARRDRLLVALVTVFSLAFPVAFWAWFDRFSGFQVAGREVLPVLALIPLIAGEVVCRRMAASGQRRPARMLLGAAIVLIAFFQAYAWWVNARYTAGAAGTIRFYAHARWSPPLGWIPWVTVAILGTLALLVFGAFEALTGSRPRSALSD